MRARFASALGLAVMAGPSLAQTPTAAELVEVCGGLSVVLGLPDAEVPAAALVLNRRAGPLPGVFSYATPGAGRVTVDIPGAGDAEAVLARLTTRGDLTIWTVTDRGYGTPPEGSLPEVDSGGWALLGEPIVASGGITKASATADAGGAPAVLFSMTPEAAEAFGTWTSENLGSAMALVYDGTILSTPVVMTPILGGQGMITGQFSVEEVETMAEVIATGALPVDVTVVSVNEVARPVEAPGALCGPDLGN